MKAPLRPHLLVTRRLPQAVLERAKKHFEVKLWPEDRPIGEALVAWAEGCDALLVMANDRLDRKKLAQLKVRAIATYSVGFEHIDIAAASELRIPVFNTPDVLSDAVAETALFLMLAAARDTTQAEHLLRAGQWGPWSPTAFVGRQLTGSILGIYGMGRIGKTIAARARPFGLEIHYHNRGPLPPQDAAGAVYHASLASLMRMSDVFCVCAPSTPNTRGIVDRAHLALLPKGAVFVNIARGDLVQEEALIEAIVSGQVGAAGLDVYANEPHIDARFLQLPRTTLLPHIGSATLQAREAMGMLALGALEQCLISKQCPANCINFDVFRQEAD